MATVHGIFDRTDNLPYNLPYLYLYDENWEVQSRHWLVQKDQEFFEKVSKSYHFIGL